MKYIFALKHTLILLLFVVLTGCSTGQVSVFSNPPEAEVFAKPVGGAELTLLGKTPTFISSSDLQKKYGSGGPMYLEIRKNGYKTDSFYLSEVTRTDLAIKRELEPVRDRLSQEWLNRNVVKMFEVRRLVEAKRYNEALNQIREAKQELPLVSTVHELEAGILLLKADYRSAVDSYRTALRLNPGNIEAQKMVKYLERTYGYTPEVEISDYKGKLPQSEGRKPTSSEEVKE